MSSNKFISRSVVLAFAIVFTQGCVAGGGGSKGGSDDASDPTTGQLVFSLRQSGPHGELFQLVGAEFEITDATGGLTFVDSFNDVPSVSASVPPGIATIDLLDGWSLLKSTDGGVTFQPVPALLGTLNPQTQRVLANTPIIVSYDFIVRDPNGTVQITLGVNAQPRELVGGVVVQSGTGDLAAYATSNRTLDFAFYFGLATLESVTLADGTKEHIYTAGQLTNIASPIPTINTPVAADFFNDHIGTLAGPIAADLAGGFLQYAVSAKPDGTVQLSGQYSGQTTFITFGPSPILLNIPAPGPDGFPADQFFYDPEIPFTATALQGTLTGVLRMRHVLPAP
jgi:hypothetical protein